MADAPALPHVGVWTGTTAQGFPASFVVSDEGAIVDLGVRIKLSFPDDRWCSLIFYSEGGAPITDGTATLSVRSEWTDFSIPLEIHFAAAGEAAATVGGVSGDHRVDCSGDVTSGTGSILDQGSFTFRRAQGATVPSGDDTRLAPGSSRPLPLGFLGSGCSHQPGSAARFCAFAKRTVDGAELWVVDLARAPLGSCAEHDPTAGCLRLSERLWTGQTPADQLAFPDSHQFHGDTLLFLADATSEQGEPFAGPTYVWRPGWTSPAQLADDPFFCTLDTGSDGAICLGKPKGTLSGAYHCELLAGRLGNGDKPLDRLGTVLLFTADDARLTDPPIRYQVGFSPDGEYVLWSTRPNFAPEARETLYTLKLGEPPEARRELGIDVSHWQVSRDGKAVFWLKSANLDRPYQPRGTLEMADFPEPSPPRLVLPQATEDYVELAVEGPDPRALVLRTASGDLMHVWNANDAIRSSERIDFDVADIRTWSPSGQVIAYSKHFGQADYWTDLHIAVMKPPVQICAVGVGANWGAPSSRPQVPGSPPCTRTTIRVFAGTSSSSPRVGAYGLGWPTIWRASPPCPRIDSRCCRTTSRWARLGWSTSGCSTHGTGAGMKSSSRRSAVSSPSLRPRTGAGWRWSTP